MDTLLKDKKERLQKLIAARLDVLKENRDKFLPAERDDETTDATLLHELNTPFHAIFNALELLKDQHKDEKSQQLYNLIETAGLELEETILRILGVSVEDQKKFDGEIISTPVKVKDILVVDDNRINVNLAKNMLEKYGYHVDVAINGKEAVEACLYHAYDLILMDVQMPVMDGVEATGRIRSLEEQQKIMKRPVIVAVTANNSKEERLRCIAAGMDAFIAKPFKWNLLPGLINTIFEPKKEKYGDQ